MAAHLISIRMAAGDATRCRSGDVVRTFWSRQRSGPSTGGASVTVAGMNFGSIDATATITLRRVCQTTSWITSSSLTCLTDGVTSSLMETSARVGGGANAHTGSFVTIFTFDGPAVTTFAPVNVPSTGGSAVSLQGMNFGAVDYTATSEIAG